MTPSCRPLTVLILILTLCLIMNGLAQSPQGQEIFIGTYTEIFSDGETFLEGPAMSPDSDQGLDQLLIGTSKKMNRTEGNILTMFELASPSKCWK